MSAVFIVAQTVTRKYALALGPAFAWETRILGLARYELVLPPMISITEPVMYDESASDARKT